MFLNRSGKAFASMLAGKCQVASSSMVICFMKRCRFENHLLSDIRELYFVQVFPAWWNSALHCSICCVFYLHQNLSIFYVDLENMYTIPVRTIWVFHRGHSQKTCHCRGGRSTGPLRGYHVPWSILGTCFLYKSIVYICTHIFGYTYILCIFMYFDISILISRDICKSKSICISLLILSIHPSSHIACSFGSGILKIVTVILAASTMACIPKSTQLLTPNEAFRGRVRGFGRAQRAAGIWH